jgi:hypothetical protein
MPSASAHASWALVNCFLNTIETPCAPPKSLEIGMQRTPSAAVAAKAIDGRHEDGTLRGVPLHVCIELTVNRLLGLEGSVPGKLAVTAYYKTELARPRRMSSQLLG